MIYNIIFGLASFAEYCLLNLPTLKHVATVYSFPLENSLALSTKVESMNTLWPRNSIPRISIPRNSIPRIYPSDITFTNAGTCASRFACMCMNESF